MGSEVSVSCVCDSKLTQVRAKDAYDNNNGVICDGCRKSIKGDTFILNCAKNSFHKNGYDLCTDCAQKSITERRRMWKRHNTICVCQRKLKETKAKDAYDYSNGVICNGCKERVSVDTLVYHCNKNAFHKDGYDLCTNCMDIRTVLWSGNNHDSKELDLLVKLITVDIGDDARQVKNIAYVSHTTKVEASSNTNDIILTYLHGVNKYWFHIEKQPFANGHFKISYRGTCYKSSVATNSLIGTPHIADGTSVVLKIKQRENPSDIARRLHIMKRSGWSKDLNELSDLEKYTNEWNKHAFSDKSYHVSKAFVLKVSNEGMSGTGQFREGEYVLIEPYMPHFEKWNWPMDTEKFAKAYSIQAFGHFTYHHSNGKELVNDAQGFRDNNKYILTDPYCVDGSSGACSQWFRNHECNKFCNNTWKRPQGVRQRQLRANVAYGKSVRNSNRVRPTQFSDK